MPAQSSECFTALRPELISCDLLSDSLNARSKFEVHDDRIPWVILPPVGQLRGDVDDVNVHTFIDNLLKEFASDLWTLAGDAV